MIETAVAFLVKPAAKWIGGILVVAAIVVGVIHYVDGVREDGEKAGATAVTNAVNTETIKRVEDARISKEKSDAEVRSTPFNDRVDQLP